LPAPDPSLIKDLYILRALAIEAGHLAQSFRLGDREARAWVKTGGSPVTEADLAVNRLCARRLTGARPDYGWLSEETADTPSTRQKERCWVVDPIDGTRAYMRDDPNWCIGLAVVEAGEAVAGVIFAPDHKMLFEARRGSGAYLNGEAISVTECAAELGCRIIASQEMLRHKTWPSPWPHMEVASPKPNATLLRMALVAAGHWDATLVLGNKSDWDLAPGAVLVHEAGGLATTHLAEPLQFNRAVPAQRSMIASGKRLHPLLVQRSTIVDIPDPQTRAPKSPAKKNTGDKAHG
jgi:myo-inositol-1(or 4)-monophosphatase